MKKILDFALSPDVKMSEIDYIFYSLNNSKHGQDLTWQFFKDNIKLFQEKYPVSFLYKYVHISKLHAYLENRIVTICIYIT